MDAKRPVLIAVIVMVVSALIGVFLLVSVRQDERRHRSDTVAAQLQVILATGEAVASQPAPGNEIRALLGDAHGRQLLAELDEAHERLAIDWATDAYVLVWNGPGGKQTVFFDPGKQPGTSLNAGMLTQITITKVQITNGDLIIWFTAASAEEIRGLVKLKPDEKYRIAIKIAELSQTDFIAIWRKATPVGDGNNDPDKGRDDKPTPPPPSPSSD